MDYGTCLQQLICDLSRQDTPQAKEDIGTLFTYPIPSANEWADVLRTVAGNNEDTDDPWHCMGEYELRLSKRGMKTVLGTVCDQLRTIAEHVGVPEEGVAEKHLDEEEFEERERVDGPSAPKEDGVLAPAPSQKKGRR